MRGDHHLEPLRDALAQGVERLALIADAMPQLVWVARGDGTIEFFNRRWIEYTNLDVSAANEDYGQAKGVVHPDDLAMFWERWSDALATGAPYEVEYRLRNAADGNYRWFIGRAVPVQDERGVIVRWVGTCTDIDEQRRTRDNLRLIAQASDILFESFDSAKNLQRLMELLVLEAADFAAVFILDSEERLRAVGTGHRDPERAELLHRVHGERLFTPEGERQEVRRLRENRPRLIRDFNVGAALDAFWPYLAGSLVPLQPNSSITIPLYSRGTMLGALYVFREASGDRYDDGDLPLFIEIGRRVSIAIENASSYERERRIAETFQRASLPISLPRIEGVRLDAIFAPGSDESEIGGDWYDAVLLRDGSLLVGVGDVMGRGLRAAVIMARMRQLIAAIALYESDPARILDSADHFVRQASPDMLITAFIGIIDPDRTTMRYANAGHRFPLLRRGGEIVELRATGLPLGVRGGAEATSYTADLRGAQFLALYTDGLVEDHDGSEEHERRLRYVTSTDAILHAQEPAALIRDACVREERRDDVAILAIRFESGESWSFTAENAQAANDARGDFVRYLRKHVRDQSAIEAAELVFGELIGNVVRHAPGPIDVRLEWSEERPRLHVIDHGEAFGGPAHLPSNPLSEDGRGLFIAEQLSKRLTFEHIPGFGNHVAAELDLEGRGVGRPPQKAGQLL